jgi:VCBS repeat protein/HYR domain-containing protein
MSSLTNKKDFRVHFRPTRVLAVVGFIVAALAVPTRSFAQAPTFDTLVTTPKGGEPWFQPAWAAVGDFNRDGKLDALVSDGGPNLRLMLGNGDGTFTEHDVSVPGTNPGMIRAADLNGDGRLDAVTVSNGGNSAVTVLLNTGNDGNGVPQFTVTNYNTFLQGVRSVTIGDLNGDDKPDLVVGTCCGSVVVLRNMGDGTFNASTSFFPPYSAPYPPDPANYYNLQPGAGGPSVGPGVIVDVNGDGKTDYVVSSNQNHATNVFFGNGDGSLQAPVVIPSYGLFMAVADVNHDGKPDLIEADSGSPDPSSGMLMVFLNSGDGRFSDPPTLYPSGLIQPLSLTTVDIDGDGNLDVVMSDFGGNGGGHQVAVLLGDGHGGFGAPNLYSVNHGPLDVSVDDFNGDGKLDIATVGRQDRTYGVLLNNSVTADTTPPTVTVVPGDQIVEATGPSGAVVTFSATATDPDDAAGPVTCTRLSGSTLGLGTTTVVCRSTDTHNNTGSATFNVIVHDTTPPAIIAVTPSQTSLWPPNKKMVPISVAVTATDAVTASPVCRISSVASNESGNGEWLITGPLTLQLQADRLGTGNGRIYTMSVVCTDAAGNASSRSTTVIVPHDQGK